LIIFVSCGGVHQRADYPLSLKNLVKTVYVDPAFDEKETNEIIKAFRSWECSTNRLYSFDLIFNVRPIEVEDSDQNLVVEKVRSTDSRIKESDAEFKRNENDHIVHTKALFTANDRYVPTILLVIDRLEYDLKIVLEHEILHAAAISHIDSENSIMNKYIDKGSRKITKLDLEEFCSLYWCNPDTMTVCNL
jgi:hypothetical protein